MLPEVAKTLDINFHDEFSYLFTGFFKNITDGSYEAIGVIYEVVDWADNFKSVGVAFLNYSGTPSGL